jgi:hypothetical protein
VTAPPGPGTSEEPRKRELRPFPAIDPEPDRRLSWRGAAKAAIALGVACVVVAAVVVGIRLASGGSGKAKHPAAPAAARFSDGNGQIVFMEEPSGSLGTAGPDGSHAAAAPGLAGMIGNDLPVASPDGRYLINEEAQLVTMGAHGPAKVTQVELPIEAAAMGTSGAQGIAGSDVWLPPSFADGGRYLAVSECDPVPLVAGTNPYESWASWLIPLAGGKPSSLGIVTIGTGDPAAEAMVDVAPASVAAARGQVTCDGAGVPSGAIVLAAPGQRAKTVVTAAALVRAAGWKAGTPVDVYPQPSPDGRRILVGLSARPSTPGGPSPHESATLLVSASGKDITALDIPELSQVIAWSPDSTKIASCSAAKDAASTVSVLPVPASGATSPAGTTITLPGHADVFCDQLLWSPDGTQLAYSADATFGGLTQADDKQHGWTIIDLRSGQVHDVKAPGQPAAWVAGTPGGAS